MTLGADAWLNRFGMKIKVYLKDPDGFYDGIADAVRDSMAEFNGKLTESEKDDVATRRSEEANEALRRWVEFGEYVSIEFDTQSKTAKVLERTKA